MRFAPLVMTLLVGCIQDRRPARDGDPRDALPDDVVVNAAVDAVVDAAMDATVDATPAVPTPIDVGVDAERLDFAIDAAVPDAGPPPVCMLDFDSPTDDVWLVQGTLYATGRYVWWRHARIGWIGRDGVRREWTQTLVPNGEPLAGEGWLITRAPGGFGAERLDLETGESEIIEQLRSFRTADGWATWAQPAGLYAQPPIGPPVRLADCIRNCPTAPFKTDRALWYLGRSRGQVEPALFRQPLDWSEHRVFEGPIRDARVTRGQEAVFWWTIANPPMGDMGRQVIAGDTTRVPFPNSPSAGSPAWLRGAGVAVFYDDGLQRTVIVDPDGQSRVTPLGRIFMGAGRFVAGGRSDDSRIVFFDPMTMEVAEVAEGRELRRLPHAGYPGAIIEVTSPEASWVYAADDDIELLFETPGRNAEHRFGPDGRSAITTVWVWDGQTSNAETWLLSPRGNRQLIPFRAREDGVGWLDAERTWRLEDGELVVDRVDGGESRRFGGDIEGAQALGRGPDGCMRVVIRSRGEASTRVIPDF